MNHHVAKPNMGTPTEALIPKERPLGLYAAMLAAVIAMVLIAIAVVEASVDPVDEGLQNIDRAGASAD